VYKNSIIPVLILEFYSFFFSVLIKEVFFFFFTFPHNGMGRRIRTSDLHFMRRDPHPIELSLENNFI
jgi:hypothetical protein